jgi:predicted ATPase
MEETVEVLLDDGALVRNGSIKLVKQLAELKIPLTVQAILASRIDRLSEESKDLLQALAVIGREFSLGLVRRVTLKSDDDLNRMLSELQLAEFIYEQPAVGDTEYIFKHALTQEVSYNSLLTDRRKLIHERVGLTIESLFAGQLEDHLDELAIITAAVEILARPSSICGAPASRLQGTARTPKRAPTSTRRWI